MQIQIPLRFAADWHQQLGDRLSPFPRSLSFGSPELTYWPDLATFIEGDCGAQMLYVPSRASSFSIHVIFNETSEDWHILKYQDCELISAINDTSYEGAMAAMLAQGPCVAEMRELAATAARH